MPLEMMTKFRNITIFSLACCSCSCTCTSCSCSSCSWSGCSRSWSYSLFHIHVHIYFYRQLPGEYKNLGKWQPSKDNFLAGVNYSEKATLLYNNAKRLFLAYKMATKYNLKTNSSGTSLQEDLSNDTCNIRPCYNSLDIPFKVSSRINRRNE
jgi:hypothetical protein